MAIIGRLKVFNYNFIMGYNPLPKFEINWRDKTNNWETNKVSLQAIYLNNRGNQSPRDFEQTILYLANLALSNLKMEDRSQAFALAWDAVSLFDIYKLFSDKLVTEAFCNEIGSPIVVTHREHGRCVTNILFTTEMWDALRIRSEYDSGLSLNALSPALKVTLASYLGNLRISMQIPPLTPKSPSFNMRRLPSEPISFDKLVNDKQIPQAWVDYLVVNLHQRKNIIIAGEPGSGKTTLANALLLKSNPHWRIIIMEDAREVIINNEDFPMATRFFMPGVGDDDRMSKRSNEIARLLHRSPDYVFLGELQNDQDTKVAFEGFAAGIKGMATTHSADIDRLLSRWIDSHKLASGLLQAIDIIVLTDKIYTTNQVIMKTKAIYEKTGDGFQVRYSA